MGKIIAHLFLFTASFIWGINFISMKYLTAVIPPFSLLFFRFLIATLFLQTLLLLNKSRHTAIEPLDKKDYKKLFITCFVGYLLFYGFQVFSFQFLTANGVALLCALIPIFSLIAEAIIYRKKFHSTIYILSITSIVGVYFVLDMHWSEVIASGTGWGIFLMCLSNICWVIFTMMASDMQKKYGTLASITYQSSVASILMGTVALIDLPKAANAFLHHPEPVSILVNLLFLGIASSGLSYLFYINGMKRIGIQLAALYMNIIPIVTAITGFFMFKDSLSLKQMLGISIVIFTLFMIHYEQEKGEHKVEVKEVLLD